MKRTILFLLAVTTALSCLFAQTTKNPFSELGYKKQVMYTSSKGEFEEFHDKADIVEIGSVYFNTKMKKVVGYVNEEKEKAEVATATSAMSVDPLCEKYYWISPYAYCLNNPVKFIDPDGRFVVAASNDAQRMILNTLPKDTRQYVTFDKNGYVNQDGLKSVESNSGNFNSLRTMALSDQTIEVRLDNKFDYSDKEGNTQTQSMTYLGVDNEYIGNNNGTGVGPSTGETGFLGKTLFPDKNGLQNSTNGNTVVVVNSNLSEEGRAQIYSHEANGHAYMYNVTNGDRPKASHNFAPGNKDLNIDLFKLINKAINETIQNMK